MDDMDDMKIKSRAEIKEERQLSDIQEKHVDPGPIEMGMYSYLELGTSICLVLKADTTMFTLPYTYFQGAEYDPRNGIKIYHACFQAVIKGRNLMPVYNLLNQYNLVTVRKAAYGEPETHETYVDEILVKTTEEIRQEQREAR